MRLQTILKLLLLIGSGISPGPELYARTPAYTNLVFEGGGIRGVAYAGALQELEARNVLDSIGQCGGTSVGAVAAMLMALGYRAAEIIP